MAKPVDIGRIKEIYAQLNSMIYCSNRVAIVNPSPTVAANCPTAKAKARHPKVSSAEKGVLHFPCDHIFFGINQHIRRRR